MRSDFSGVPPPLYLKREGASYTTSATLRSRVLCLRLDLLPIDIGSGAKPLNFGFGSDHYATYISPSILLPIFHLHIYLPATLDPVLYHSTVLYGTINLLSLPYGLNDGFLWRLRRRTRCWFRNTCPPKTPISPCLMDSQSGAAQEDPHLPSQDESAKSARRSLC